MKRPVRLYMAVEEVRKEWTPVLVGSGFAMVEVIETTQARLAERMHRLGFSRGSWRVKEFRMVGTW